MRDLRLSQHVKLASWPRKVLLLGHMRLLHLKSSEGGSGSNMVS